MKRVLFVLAVLSLQGPPLFGQSDQDSLQFVINEKTEIDHTLREIVEHSVQAKQKGLTVPADDIEMDIMRLGALLEKMDISLKDLPCDTAAPVQPDTQQALNALRSLIVQVGDEQQRKEIIELKERIVFVKKIHDLSVALYKLTLLSTMTETLIELVPTHWSAEFLDIIVDDILNLTQPGEAKNWGRKNDYKKYLAENQHEMEALVFEKAKTVNGINENGELKMQPTEHKRIIHEIVIKKTTEDVKYFEDRIKTIEKTIGQDETEDNQRNAYFAGLIRKLEQVLSQSIWINNPGTFAKTKASINVVLADDGTGAVISHAKAKIDPNSGIVEDLADGIRFQGISAGNYIVEGVAGGYVVTKQSVNVTECKQYNLVIRLKKESSPAPPGVIAAPPQNNLPEEISEEDDRFYPESEPSVIEQFQAWLTCGSTLEIVAGEIDRSCGVVVSGWRGNTSDRVEVIFTQQMESGSLPGQIIVFPDNASQDPSNMFTAGVSDLHDQYEFPFQFSARATAPQGSSPLSIVVRQPGVDEVRLVLTVNVLAKGQISVPGAGNAPPAVRGSGGNYCVWRHKLLSDMDPNCWHFVAAACDNARYRNPNNGYVMAGSEMSQVEADALITEQSAFFNDTCKNTQANSSDSPAQSENLSAQLQSGKNLYDRCQYQEAINVMNVILQAATSNRTDSSISGSVMNTAKDYIGRSQQSIAGITRIEAILLEAESARNSCNFTAGTTVLGQINAIDPPSKECKAQYLNRANALKNELNDLQSEIDWSQMVITEAENHFSACRFKEAAEAANSALTASTECEETSQKKASEIKAKAETMMQIEDEIGTERVLAEMAIAKNLKDRKAVIQNSMQNTRNLVMQSGNSPCFQKYLEVVNVFDKALAPNALDGLGLQNYGSGDTSENDSNGWGAATLDASNNHAEVINETPPPEADPTVAQTDDSSNQNTTKWQNTLSNLLENVTEAIVESQTGYPSDPNNNDNQNTEGTNQNSGGEDLFVGKWNGTVSLISRNGPRDSDGNEICEFEGAASDNRELTIMQGNYGYALHDDNDTQRYYARSGQEHTGLRSVWMTTRDVSGNTIRFNETKTFNRETITTTIELEVNGNRLAGTMRLVTASGCDYRFSINANR